MKGTAELFSPMEPLLHGVADPRCRAVVVVPARNEEAVLARCLDGLAQQVDLQGRPLDTGLLECLVLLNNCSDSSWDVAARWRDQHPEFALHLVTRRLPPEKAHVGTARRWLMDTAWHRLQKSPCTHGALLSTDADTLVARDWVAQCMAALDAGADVVGGAVEILPAELLDLPAALQACYRRDRHYAALIAELEDLLDPQPGDPRPRHLDHFGSSLACTVRAYELAGGLPAVSPLEDEAFVDRVRRAGLRLRHEPRVRVFTSARIAGRAPVGMAQQLRTWGQLRGAEQHQVASAAFLAHRFRTLHRLREIFTNKDASDFPLATPWWEQTFAEALEVEESYPAFLAAVYCDVLIRESFRGQTIEPIDDAIASLEDLLESSLATSCL